MIAIIPARGGSKGVPGKNRRLFLGSSLIRRAAFSVQGLTGHVYVSTDDPLIAAEARTFTNVIMRPPELGRDDTPMLAVIQHAIGELKEKSFAIGWETLAILQPTAPLRTTVHVRAAMDLLANSGADSVVSVVEIPAHSHPYQVVDIQEDRLRPWATFAAVEMDDMPTRRQATSPVYVRDGTIYLIRRSVIEAGSLYGARCIPLIIPSFESATIDTEEDWVRAEELARRRNLL